MNPRVRRARTGVGCLLVAATLLASCSVRGEQARSPSRTGSAPATTEQRPSTDPTIPPTSTAGPPDRPALAWSECDSGFECAELEVPVDHDEPEGATLTLAVVRRPAGDPSRRIGALLMNPGGPGGSATTFVEGSVLPSELTERFDVIGFDPRGVGRSSPLDCRTHLQDIYQVDPTMEDQADRDTYVETSRAFVDECAEKYRELLPFLGTVDVARDMDEVRKALGEETISYVGYSYGTSLGQQYAKAFPANVRAMVLDGVVDTSVSGLDAALGQAKGFTRALDNFVASCDTDGCGLDEPAGPAIDEVIAAAERAPIPAPGAGRPATPGVVALALAQGLYSEALWPELGRALAEARAGDGNALVALADQYLQRDPDGSYPNGFEVYFGVSCLDATWPKDPKAVFDAAERAGAQYRRLGEALVNDYVRCALWPGDPQPLTPLSAAVQGLPPIVVISTTGDPATPYESGAAVVEQIPGAVLVTNQGEGHTIFAQGKACIDDPVTAYLTDLVPPPDGLTCG